MFRFGSPVVSEAESKAWAPVYGDTSEAIAAPVPGCVTTGAGPGVRWLKGAAHNSTATADAVAKAIAMRGRRSTRRGAGRANSKLCCNYSAQIRAHH